MNKTCKSNDNRTLDLFASDPFKIMLSKGGFLWKLRNCGYSTEKTLFLMNLIIKLTLGNIFIKVKNLNKS